jgi:hypothetical protein
MTGTVTNIKCSLCKVRWYEFIITWRPSSFKINTAVFNEINGSVKGCQQCKYSRIYETYIMYNFYEVYELWRRCKHFTTSFVSYNITHKTFENMIFTFFNETVIYISFRERFTNGSIDFACSIWPYEWGFAKPRYSVRQCQMSMYFAMITSLQE